MDKSIFAEGLTVSNDGKIYQLTWKEKKFVIWDLNTEINHNTTEYTYTPWIIQSKSLPLKETPYDLREGWGLAYNYDLKTSKDLLYATDGSSNIYVIDIDLW